MRSKGHRRPVAAWVQVSTRETSWCSRRVNIRHQKHTSGGKGSAFPERCTLPTSFVCKNYCDHFSMMVQWVIEPPLEPICVVSTAHDRRVLHDQARHDVRSEDASARPADEGRRPAAIRWRSRSQAVSPSSPNGATPSWVSRMTHHKWEVSGGTETSHVPRGSKTSPGVVASETGSA